MTTIKLKNGSGAPAASDLVQGEPALDLTNKRLYTENASGAVIEVGINPSTLTTTTITGTVITAETSVVPDASDGATLGSASLEWSDLYLADGAIVYFGDDQDITLTHVADTGLTLKHANTADDKFPTFLLATGDTDIAINDKLGVINFQAPDEGAGTDAILVAAGIEAVSEGDFSASSNATSLVFKTGASEAAAEKARINSSGNISVGSASNFSSAKIAINRTPPTAFGSPMLQVGQESFVGNGIYSLGLGYTGSGYTAPPAEIAAVSTSSSGGTTADIIFGTRNVTTNTAVTERMRLDSEGRLLLNTLIEGQGSADDLTIAGTGNVGITIRSGTSSEGAIYFSDGTSGTAEYECMLAYDHSSNFLRIITNHAEAARIDSTGNLLVAKTSASGTTLGPELLANGQINSASAADFLNMYSTSGSAYRFYVTNAGTINATSTSISAISDQSLKENIRDLDKGLETINALQPRRFDWKNGDGNDIMGFVAQEVENVLPELVHEYKYTEEENKLSLKMGDMVPPMVKAIQELSAQVTELKAEVAALKGA